MKGKAVLASALVAVLCVAGAPRFLRADTVAVSGTMQFSFELSEGFTINGPLTVQTQTCDTAPPGGSQGPLPSILVIAFGPSCGSGTASYGGVTSNGVEGGITATGVACDPVTSSTDTDQNGVTHLSQSCSQMDYHGEFTAVDFFPAQGEEQNLFSVTIDGTGSGGFDWSGSIGNFTLFEGEFSGTADIDPAEPAPEPSTLLLIALCIVTLFASEAPPPRLIRARDD